MRGSPDAEPLDLAVIESNRVMAQGQLGPHSLSKNGSGSAGKLRSGPFPKWERDDEIIGVPVPVAIGCSSSGIGSRQALTVRIVERESSSCGTTWPNLYEG